MSFISFLSTFFTIQNIHLITLDGSLFWCLNSRNNFFHILWCSQDWLISVIYILQTLDILSSSPLSVILYLLMIYSFPISFFQNYETSHTIESKNERSRSIFGKVRKHRKDIKNVFNDIKMMKFHCVFHFEQIDQNEIFISGRIYNSK